MRTLPVLLALVVASGTFASGHHSFAAYYFEDQSVTIEGTVTEFEYRSPHAWLHLSVMEDSGTAETYSAEWANPNRLSRNGITKETLQPGDRVIITGSPGRTASERKIHLKQIERPADGWRWGRQRRR